MKQATTTGKEVKVYGSRHELPAWEHTHSGAGLGACTSAFLLISEISSH